MIHARLTHAELALLRKGSPREAVVEKTAGAHRPEPGQTVTAYARAEYEDGELVRRRQQVRCVIFTVEDEAGQWRCGYRPGATEKPRFLTARPGKRGDYTTEERYAMVDEPEAVPESWERQVARVHAAWIPYRVQHHRRPRA